MKRQITVIHPSRSRPNLCFKTASLFFENSSKQNIEYFISLDESDQTINQYIDNKLDFALIKIGPTNSCIESINFASKETSFQDILVVVSDDFICEKNWDNKIRASIGDRKDFVLKTNDGREGWIVTFPIMDRVYYERFGYVYNPVYKHLFCDTEMTHVADITGKLIVDMNIKIEHLAKCLTQDDEVNRKNDSTWGQGEPTYLRRVRENFGLNPSEIIKNVEHTPHLDWLRQRGIKV
jgi:hypothetical protein